MTIEGQKKEKNWTWSKYLALILLTGLIISPFLIYSPLSDWYQKNSELQKPRAFHVVYGAYLQYGSELAIDLTISCPKSILVVDDKVTIDGLAIVEYPSLDFEVVNVTMGFENSLSYPVTQVNEITVDCNFTFDRVEPYKFVGRTDVTWALEGTYRAILRIVWHNSSGTYLGPRILCENMALTIHPKSDLAQIVTNETSMIMTIVFFVLTIVGTFSLILTLWDRKTPAQNSSGNIREQDSTSSR